MLSQVRLPDSSYMRCLEDQVQKAEIRWGWGGELRTRFSSVRLIIHVQLFATPWTAAHQASLSITNSQSPPKPMSIESVMPSNHFILCRVSPSPAFNLFQHQGLFKWVSSSHQVAKILEFQPQHHPRDCSMPGFPVHHQLLELAQTHVHWVSDVV